jgi:hypothetical protein
MPLSSCQGMQGTESANSRYLAWVRGKHRSQRVVFVDHLIRDCASEFALHHYLTEDQRAEIYKRVRDSLQLAYDAGIRKHAKIGCCS